MFWREFALEISVDSLGSSQILRLPQPRTLAAKLFCVRRFGIVGDGAGGGDGDGRVEGVECVTRPTYVVV